MRTLNRLALAALAATCAGMYCATAYADDDADRGHRRRADNIVARWIQLGPGSSAAALAAGSYGDQPSSKTPTVIARAVISGGACPVLTVNDGRSMTMKLRFTGGQLTDTPGTAGFNNAPTGGYPQYFVNAAATAPGTFPDGTAKATTDWGVCEAIVPHGHEAASIGGVRLKLPVANPRRILVIADTGCRMAKANQQNCHDPAGFPFASLANFEALFEPDLVVHIGDYFYRDTNCIVPAAGSVPAHEFVAGCSDPANANYETWGDTFDSWNADLFYPGKTLLAAAPWVMTHANHESCGRGARGWYALLDPLPFDANKVKCAGGTGSVASNPVTGTTPVYSADFEPTYIVPAGSVNLLVHDSSFANDGAVDVNMAKNYDYDMTALLNSLPANSYNAIVTHKPVFGLVKGATNNAGDFTEQFAFSGNATANSAFSGGVPYKVPLFLSGHIHQFEYVNFKDFTHYAPQLIVGIGGDNLDPTANPDGVTTTYGYQNQDFTVHNSATTGSTTTTSVARAFSRAEFGFALLEPRKTGFVADVYDINAKKVGRCTIKLNPRDIQCWE